MRQKEKEKTMQALKQPLETTTSTAATSTSGSESIRRRTPPSRQTNTSPSASVPVDRRGTPVDRHPSPSAGGEMVVVDEVGAPNADFDGSSREAPPSSLLKKKQTGVA